MRNALFYGLLVLVVAILALIAYGVYLNFAQSGANLTQAVCGGAIVIVALLFWELMMKPGRYRRPREPAKKPEGPDEGEGPPSP